MLCWPKGLSSKGQSASTRRHNNDFTELEVVTAIGHLGQLMPLNLQVKKGVTVLAGAGELVTTQWR